MPDVDRAVRTARDNAPIRQPQEGPNDSAYTSVDPCLVTVVGCPGLLRCGDKNDCRVAFTGNGQKPAIRGKDGSLCVVLVSQYRCAISWHTFLLLCCRRTYCVHQAVARTTDLQ